MRSSMSILRISPSESSPVRRRRLRRQRQQSSKYNNHKCKGKVNGRLTVYCRKKIGNAIRLQSKKEHSMKKQSRSSKGGDY
jgi:hypothetical protein